MFIGTLFQFYQWAVDNVLGIHIAGLSPVCISICSLGSKPPPFNCTLLAKQIVT